MATQAQQLHAGSDSSQNSQHPAAPYHHDTRAPYAVSYAQHLPVGNRDGAAPVNPALSQLLGGLHLQGHRAGTNGPFMYLPGAPVFGGHPQVTPFPSPVAVPGHEQMHAAPFVGACMVPNMNSPLMLPATMPPYVWPPVLGADMHDPNGQRKNAWGSEGDHKGSSASKSAAGSQVDFHPFAGAVGSVPLAGFPFNSIPPQLPQPGFPLQMMKTATGYVLQDLEVLTQQDPPIPRAVPAMWTNPNEITLAKCLENREGITNVYIRGFLPETTDEMLHAYAARFGKIDRCKAIIDLDTGLCKGFGFVQYFNFESCENCIRGFFYLGYQASFAQKSRNSRLKDLEDKTSTNIYCTNVPIDWTEADLRRHFEPYRVVSEKISRDEKTGVSKEVGFARFESREIAEKVLAEFHNITGKDGVKLLLRFADTKAQKFLKQQSNERRAYRTGEYNYSVEVVQGSTPSPTIGRLQQASSHFSPASQGSYHSPAGVGSNWTPATSISSSYAMQRTPCPAGGLADKANSCPMKNPVDTPRGSGWPARTSLGPLENTPLYRGRNASCKGATLMDNMSASSSKTVLAQSPGNELVSVASSPEKENSKVGSMSPVSASQEMMVTTPRSVV